MTTRKTKPLATRSRNIGIGTNNGLTLLELLILVLVIGVISAVALAQLSNQTKKDTGTKGSQAASSIAKQAATNDPRLGILSDVDNTCTIKTGALKSHYTKFDHEYPTSEIQFAV